MLSLFYKIIELKLTNDIYLTIFKPNKNSQIILIKGKLGQFKLKWFCSKNEEYNKIINQQNNNNLQNFKIYSIWTQNYINENNFWTFKKENKHFIFNKKLNKMNDIILIRNTNINNNDLNHITIFNEIKNIKNNKLLNKKTNIQEKKNNNIYMGYLMPYKGMVNKTEEYSKLFNQKIEIQNTSKKQIKNIITGITQGFSINLELKGIGFQARIENMINNISNNNIQQTSNFQKIGQLENNIQQIQQSINLIHLKNKKNIFKNIKLKQELLNLKKIKNIIKIKINKFLINKEKKNLILNLGTSHSIIYPLYKNEINVKLTTSPNNFVTLSIFSISYKTMKQIAAKIYLLKKPEPYKGKGIRYDGEKFFSKEKTKKS